MILEEDPNSNAKTSLYNGDGGVIETAHIARQRG